MEETAGIFDKIGDLPGWTWVIALIGLAVIFGKRVEWELEAKMRPESGSGRNGFGEMEITKYKKENLPVLEVEFRSDITQDPGFDIQRISFRIGDEEIGNLAWTRDKGGKYECKLPYTGTIPKEGETASIRYDGQALLSGVIYIDSQKGPDTYQTS